MEVCSPLTGFELQDVKVQELAYRHGGETAGSLLSGNVGGQKITHEGDHHLMRDLCLS